MYDHTGGTYFHSGVVDCPRFPISELHQGKFRDSMEFQSWKVNLKTEVCSKTADPHLTMQWIKEVEMPESSDDLVTSQSITGRNDFPDYDDCGCIEETSRQACSLPLKSKCRRAAC